MAERSSKLVDIKNALAGVPDGATLIVAGAHFNNVPMAMVRELLRSGAKDLTLIPTPAAGIWVDTLIGAGVVSRVFVSYVGLEVVGLAPNFRRAAESGEIAIVEVDESTIFHGLRAAGSGLPFVALPPIHLLGDLPRVSPDVYRTIENPFTGEVAVAVPPLTPDVALLHFAKADIYGNAVSLSGLHMEDVIAKAARRVIISAEEIVPPEEISNDPTRTTLPGLLVDAVVHAPWGAYPCTCPGVYEYDDVHVKQYYELANAGRTGEYLQKYVTDVANDDVLLGEVSSERRAELASL